MIDEIDTTEEAFLSAIVPNRIDDLKLQPYGIMRQAVAIGLGINNSSEDGFFDSVVMVWLCTLTEDEVLEAKRKKKAALKDAFKWAEDRGYSVVNFQPLLEVYQKIMGEIMRSSDAVLSGNNGEPEKNSGEQRAL